MTPPLTGVVGNPLKRVRDCEAGSGKAIISMMVIRSGLDAMAKNLVLASLLTVHPDFERRLTPIEFCAGDTVVSQGGRIDNAIFPMAGILSVVVVVDGDYVETAMVGSEGAIGGSVAFGLEEQPSTIIGRMSGAAYLLASEDLIDLAARDSSARNLVFACEGWLSVQAQQLSACNARHKISQRFSSWLLRASDAARSDAVIARQDLIAAALGIQRGSVSTAAAELQAAGCIRYTRGRITILRRAALEQKACECHRRLGAYRRSLFGTTTVGHGVPQ